MSDDRDIGAFGRRAAGYDRGALGRLHHDIADRVASIAVAAAPAPRRVLDVGCGTGYLLRVLAERLTGAEVLYGVDAAPPMAEIARTAASDARIEVREGRAERLPYADHELDLVVSTTSFDHWQDQAAGLVECARVLAADGALVLADLFSPLLAVTLVGRRRAKARTPARAGRLVAASGLRVVEWAPIVPLVRALTARPAAR